jgi:hypothetical protein
MAIDPMPARRQKGQKRFNFLLTHLLQQLCHNHISPNAQECARNPSRSHF